MVLYEMSVWMGLWLWLPPWIPLRCLSRLVGWLSELPLPRRLRHPLLGFFTYLYECDMSECVQQDLTKYRTFNDFFTRSLMPTVRPIHPHASLVSPVDGHVIECGSVADQQFLQVKGVAIPLSQFLACGSPDTFQNLRYCSFYLSPGEYHRFHSPAHWHCTAAHHVSGGLLPVHPWYLRSVHPLVSKNERVVLTGIWAYGYFSMTAVGALHVGSVVIHSLPKMATNTHRGASNREVISHTVNQMHTPGGEVGLFRLGSMVVLIFEAPPSAEWCVQRGSRVSFGEAVVRVR